MEQLDLEHRNIIAFTSAEGGRERDGEGGRSISTCAAESGPGRSSSIDELWDVLQPAAAIF